MPSGKRNKTAPVLPAALECEAHRAAGEHEGVSPLGWNSGYLLPSGKRNKIAPVLPAALEGEVHRAAGEHEGVSPLGWNFGYLYVSALVRRHKDSPLFQHQNKGLSCGVRFHHLRTSFSFLAAHGYWAPHTDSDRCEGKCSFKISHHCVPSPELQNPVCFRPIQYIGLTSKASTEPLL